MDRSESSGEENEQPIQPKVLTAKVGFCCPTLCVVCTQIMVKFDSSVNF